MLHFVAIDVFAFFGFLFATFVQPFILLNFPSESLLIFLSHSYLVLDCCFLLLAFQSRLFLFLLCRYILELYGECFAQTHRELPSVRLAVG